MMFLYSSTVVFNWAFWSKTTSFSATAELIESPLTALLFKLFVVSTSLQLLRWFLLVTLLLLAIEGLVLVLLPRPDLLLTSCVLRFSTTPSSHLVPSPSIVDVLMSGKCWAKRSLTFVTSTVWWVWNEPKLWFRCYWLTLMNGKRCGAKQTTNKWKRSRIMYENWMAHFFPCSCGHLQLNWSYELI